MGFPCSCFPIFHLAFLEFGKPQRFIFLCRWFWKFVRNASEKFQHKERLSVGWTGAAPGVCYADFNVLSVWSLVFDERSSCHIDQCHTLPLHCFYCEVCVLLWSSVSFFFAIVSWKWGGKQSDGARIWFFTRAFTSDRNNTPACDTKAFLPPLGMTVEGYFMPIANCRLCPCEDPITVSRILNTQSHDYLSCSPR